MEEKQVKEVLKFIDSVITQANAQEFENARKLFAQESESARKFFAFISAFMERYKKAAVKLPYHINLIDELRANENAHSRILAKLLQQKTSHKRFEILEGFIEYLTEKKTGTFHSIRIETPEITQETERIDLWVRDKTYAIIIENKIHYASDQERQLERYIDKTKEKGFSNEQIFVVYLSPRREEPNEQSWGKYKDEFKERYLNLSFKDDILYWLKEKVLPDVKLKDVFLRSAIEQYIDHLEGMFSLRTINNKVNMELKEFIKNELGLNGTPQENIAKLLVKKEEINKVNNQIDLLLKDTEKDISACFKNYLLKKYSNYQCLETIGNQWEINIATIIIPMENIQLRVYVALEFGTNKLFCQVDTEVESQKTVDEKLPELPAIVYEKIKATLPQKYKNDNTKVWKYFDRYDYNGLFECFQEVLSILIRQE
ncbi:MAG: PD-(D/E)XK nuclease family protein [Bacteroidales bacterium]|jgi:hypothetical protein|nr:PD-(D/E)XK nuclease family protein [Bacteroidales bacterium]